MKEHSHHFISRPDGTVQDCSCGLNYVKYVRYHLPYENYRWYQKEGGKMSYKRWRGGEKRRRKEAESRRVF